MQDETKSREQLIIELEALRLMVAESEKGKTASTDPSELRRRAEDRLEAEQTETGRRKTDDTERLYHELAAHQIELEMQNEELRNALVQIEESRTRYSELYDFAPVGYLTLDENGLVLEANLTISRQLGIVRSRLVGSPLSVYIVTADRGALYSHLRSVFKDKTHKSCEVRFMKAGGGCCHALLETILVEDAGDNRRFRTAVTDITERKQAEEALRVSLRFLELVNKHTETAPLLKEYVSEIKNYTGCDAVGIRVLDENLNIPYEAYEGFSREFYESESALSLKSDECMCINVIRGDVDPDLPFFTEGGAFCVNATSRFLAVVSEKERGRTRNRCNEEGYETVGLFPVRGQGGILGLIHVADQREDMLSRDVVKTLEKAAMQLGTAFERARTNHRLRESEEFKTAVLDSMPSHVAVLDRKGIILSVNEPWVRFAIENGAPKRLPAVHAGPGVDYLRVCRESTGESSEGAMAAHDGILAVLGGTLPKFSLEYPCHSPGVDRWFSMTATPLGAGEGGVVVSHGDITQRKRAEREREALQAELNQAQKMESIGILAGGVAHDFNNMLGVILGRTEMAMDGVDPKQPAYADLTEIRSAARRSADLVGQLLAFARKRTISPRLLDINETVEIMLKMVRRLIGEDIELLWKPAKNLWPVRMDPTQIDQILANLCVNARDAIAGTGVLSIETRNVSVDLNYYEGNEGAFPGDYVLLAVADTGSGMEQKIVDKVFEPFFTTKEVGKGTGLGLSTVYGIIKQNGGFIEIDSEPGRGTTFRVYLPRTEVSGLEDKLPAQPLEASGGTETILLVEDERSILVLAKKALESRGYNVLAAGGPGEALGLAETYTGRIDLMITDVVMPKMNGKDLAERMHASIPGLKQLFISGYAGEIIDRHGLFEGGKPFLQKPFSIQALLQKVREVLDGK